MYHNNNFTVYGDSNITVPVMVNILFQSQSSVATVLINLLGGVTMGFYVLGLTMLGEQYKGQVLVSANASFIFFLSIGEILGPPIIGRAMDIFGNSAFGWAMGIISLLFLSVFYFSRSLINRKQSESL